MIGYLSGPITGHKDYRRQFAKAAAALEAGEGYTCRCHAREEGAQ